MRLLENILQIRANLATLILLAVTLTQRIAATRETLKGVEDTLVNEIWTDERYKNDRARNEQKHLARINDDRYVSVANQIQQYEMDKAKCHADILVAQNELTVATTQYQQALLSNIGNISFNVGGLQFSIQATEAAGADTVKAIDVKTQASIATPVNDADLLPRLAQAVLEAHTVKGVPNISLANADRYICEIVAGGETRFLDGAALQRVRDLHASLPGMTAVPCTSPVEVIQDGKNAWIAKGATFTDLQSSSDYAFGDTEEEARANYMKGARVLEVPTAEPAIAKAAGADDEAPF